MRERPHKYIPGDYLLVCDECGRVFRKSEMKKRWDNLWVCADDFEIRHPQLDVRGKRDKINVPVARPALEDGDITMGTSTLGDGWTEEDENTFTSDGTSAGSSVTWSPTLSATDYYEISVRVTDGGAAGTVKGVCGGLETTTITTGYATKYGLVSNVSGTVGITQASNWTGTVWVKIRKVTTRDDL